LLLPDSFAFSETSPFSPSQINFYSPSHDYNFNPSINQNGKISKMMKKINHFLKTAFAAPVILALSIIAENSQGQGL